MVRILFVAFYVFIDDPKAAAACMGLVSVMWLLIQVYTAPYVNSALDFLQTCLSVGLLILSFSGVMFSIKPLHQGFRETTEYAELTMVCLMALATAYVGVKEMITKLRLAVSIHPCFSAFLHGLLCSFLSAISRNASSHCLHCCRPH